MSQQSSQFVLNCSRVALQGGLKTFANEIMKALLAEGFPCESVLPYGYSVPEGVKAIFTPASLAGASDVSFLRPLKWLAYSQFFFPVAKSRRILCTTHHVLPNRKNQIVTVHDLRPYFFPDTSAQSFYFRHMLPKALQHCEGILTVSETSRQLIADVYKISLDRIAVVPNVVSTCEKVEDLLDRTEERFLLMVGASWPHKNVEALLRQHQIWSDRYGLKIVAGKGQYRTKMEQISSSLGISDRVQFLSDVSHEKLEQLYGTCSALIAPSRMEGFGLPPLEAMMRNCPVIVADIPSFRELYGEYAVYVKTEESRSWEEAFEALGALSTGQLKSAQIHAGSYNLARMREALRAALQAFWGV